MATKNLEPQTKQEITHPSLGVIHPYALAELIIGKKTIGSMFRMYYNYWTLTLFRLSIASYQGQADRKTTIGSRLKVSYQKHNH